MEIQFEKKINATYKLEKKLVFNLLKKLVYGQLTIIDADNTYYFGQTNNPHDFHAVITVNHHYFYRALLIDGSNGAAESYIEEQWQTDNLTHLIEIMIKNERVLKQLDSNVAKIKNCIFKLYHTNLVNNKKNAKKNIRAHYDLGNEFFTCFLDPTLMYSSAVYPHSHSHLTEASLHKLSLIGEKLNLTHNDNLLEIGTGWGGLAIFLAQKYGCHVTTTTISEQQYIYVKNKISALGLDHKIRLMKQDYRDLKGKYDKLVSIEMIEAVGHQYFDSFFKQCDSLLKPNGLMFLQAIVINDKNYLAAKNQIDFIKKYIFPGGCLPSIHAITQATAKYTHLQLVYLNDIGDHYAHTLIDWKNNFELNVATVKKLGFSNKFIRMWKYYFCYCTAAFNQKYIGNIQTVWQKRA